MDKGILYRVSRGRYAFTLPLFGGVFEAETEEIAAEVKERMLRSLGKVHRLVRT